MTIIEQIKAEIERLKDENNNIRCDSNKAYCQGYGDAFVDLLPLLSTLESEKPMNQKELEREIERCLWQLSDDPSNEELRMFARHFAKWGAEHAREQMKEAVEGKIIFLLNGDVAVNIGDTDKYNLGQKVRVIVLPKED